jgi:DDE family transposase
MKPDLFTPFFVPWRARLTAALRALPRAESSQPILHQLEALFGGWLLPHWLSPREEGAFSRQRDWPLRLTFWTFLAQVLCPGSSCRAAVRQAQAQARLERRPVPAEDTSAYCQARGRLPLKLLQELIQRVGGSLQQRVPERARWCGRGVKVLDGTTLTAEDTPANQKAFAQPRSQKKGCGFPLVRLVALFSLASGALLGFATGNYLQSELALAAQLWALLEPGDVLLADRYFGCYRVLALVKGCQADGVCRLHASRQADFRFGKRRGSLDREVLWRRPKEVPPGVSALDWLALPLTLTVRLVRFTVSEKGFRTRRVTLVTTLLDAQKYPVHALAALYRRRWQVELNFRQIKTALSMEHLAVKSPAMIDRALAMHLLAYQLIRALMQEGALSWDVPLERISFQGAVDGARHFGEALLRARSKRQRTALYAELLRILATDDVPERPGRYEPRAVKRRLKAYPRLNCERKKFRDIPHRNRRLSTRAKARKNRAAI